jgi:putative membrane protein
MISRIAASGVVAISLLCAAPLAMAESTQAPTTGAPGATSPRGTTGTSAAKASKTEEAFIKKAIEGNLAEVSAGKLGQEKGANAEVKSFGEMLVADHSAANEKATAAAKEAGVTPPTKPTAKQKQAYETLSKLSGAKFDRQFADEMVKGHKEAVADYTKAAKGSGPIADYAKATLPTLREHLQHAEALTKGTKSQKHSAK